jgi:hypothetical protein
MNENSKINSNQKQSGGRRKSKKDKNGRDFICSICEKSYLSYRALYTHKRNKHNIIPITGKPEVFKNNSTSFPGKFKYSAFDSSINVKALSEDLIASFYKLCREQKNNPNSIFYNPDYSLDDDYFIKVLKYYCESGLHKVQIPTQQESGQNSIYHFLAIYLILLLEITKDKFFCELLVKFAFMLREYLNLIGWDHKKKLMNYGIISHFTPTGEYCSKNSCEDLPELMDDFVCVFLEIDELSSANAKDLTDICQNFCFWLYINKFTCYKLAKVEE